MLITISAIEICDSVLKPKCPCSEKSYILLDWVCNSSNNNSYLLVIHYCIIIVTCNTPVWSPVYCDYDNCSTKMIIVWYTILLSSLFVYGLALFLMAGRVFLMADSVLACN